MDRTCVYLIDADKIKIMMNKLENLEAKHDQ